MPMRAPFKFGICRFLICAAVICCYATNRAQDKACAADNSTDFSDSHKQVFEQIESLVKQFYPRAKMSHDSQHLHIEYKVRNSQNLYSGRTELAPEQGGILADLEFKQGAFKSTDKLPKTQNQYSYMVLQMAPFLAQEQQHLSTRLCYAPDTSPDFVLQFGALLDDFAKQQSAGSNSHQDEQKHLEQQPSSASNLKPAATTQSEHLKVSAPVTVPQVHAGRKLFFWKAIRGKEIVFLLGTIHIATANFYPLAAEIDDSFDQSKNLIVEVAIDRHSPDRKVVEQLVRDFGTYKSPDRLTKHLSPDTRKILEEYLTWAGETIELYEEYKPWYVTQLIAASAPRRGEVLKIKGGLGLDRYFLKRAGFAGTKVTELESLESQLHLHSGLSDDMQDKLLRVSLLEYKDSQNEIKSIFDAWLAGDPKQLDQIVNQSVHLHPELAPYMNTLLNNRNSGMVTKIDQLSKTATGPIFVAVGAAHLLGDTGLVSGLRKLGFDVEQLQESNPVAPGDFPDSLVFGENRFKVWLPKEPQKKTDAKSQALQYELADGEDKLYAVNVLELGGDQNSWKAPGPLALDSIAAAIVKRMHGTNIVRHSFKIQELACRQIDFSIVPPTTSPGKDDKAGTPQDAFFILKKPGWFDGKSVRVRSYLVGSKAFVQLACGDKTFIDSSDVNKFMNSLKFIR